MTDDAFWREVVSLAGIGPSEFAELRHLETRIVRLKFVIHSSLPHLRRDPAVVRFMQLQRRLLEAVAHIARARVAVDSSKAGPRAWLLATDPSTRILHLYRSPASVLASWRSRKFDPGMQREMQRLSLLRASIDWLKVEALTRKLSKQTVIHRLDYDHFVSSPQTSIASALTTLDLGHFAPPQWTGANRFVDGPDYHSVNGNPDRFARSEIHIAPRSVNRTNLDLTDRLMIPVASTALKIAFPAPEKHADC